MQADEAASARLADILMRWLCYAEDSPMRVLFAITVLALAALLWATISIAFHVRRVRGRQRRSHAQAAAKPVNNPR